jgi:hypothetical protein
MVPNVREAGSTIRRSLLYALLLTSGALISSSAASANPAVSPDFDSRTELLFYLAVTNLPIDLFCFSALILLVCGGFGGAVGRIQKKPAVFLAMVVSASIVIALVGALIDFLAFYEKDAYGYSLGWGGEEQAYMSENLYLALAAVFISVLLAATLIVRTSIKAGLYTAVGMMAINFASWMYILSASDGLFKGIAVILSMFFGVLALLPFYYLYKWHKNEFSGRKLASGEERVTV